MKMFKFEKNDIFQNFGQSFCPHTGKYWSKQVVWHIFEMIF